VDHRVVAYQAGTLSVPGGHNADGFDLQTLRDRVRGLWSVKNTTKASRFRLTNGMSGAGRGFTEPVILLSRALPGLTFAHPDAHSDIAATVQQKDDHICLPARDDPWMDYVKSLLEPQRFPRLSKLFPDAAPRQRSLANEITELAKLSASRHPRGSAVRSRDHECHISEGRVARLTPAGI
jgi:hypothetical protein